MLHVAGPTPSFGAWSEADLNVSQAHLLDNDVSYCFDICLIVRAHVVDSWVLIAVFCCMDECVDTVVDVEIGLSVFRRLGPRARGDSVGVS